MTASAGAATAAQEGRVAGVAGETGGAQAAIVIVSGDPFRARNVERPEAALPA